MGAELDIERLAVERLVEVLRARRPEATDQQLAQWLGVRRQQLSRAQQSGLRLNKLQEWLEHWNQVTGEHLSALVMLGLDVWVGELAELEKLVAALSDAARHPRSEQALPQSA